MTGRETTGTGTEILGPLLAEYAELKAEQRARIGFRDNFIYVTLAASAAVGWAAIERNLPHLLLLIPMACFALSWTYLRNDVQIAQIRDYIRDTLKPRVTRVTGDSDIFGWEFEKIDDRRRNGRKWMQLVVDLGVFVLPSAVVCIGLGQTAERYGFGPGAHVLVSAAIMMTAVMAAQFCVYAAVPLPNLRLRRRGGESR